MASVTRSVSFWIVFALGSCVAAFTAYRFFSRAFPIIHLTITMDRSQAVQEAKQIAISQSLGPSDAHAATSFSTDEDVKTFIELEGGGKEKVVAVMHNDLYQIYTWQVRLFKPLEQHEVTIQFRPDGAPYGFREKLSDNDPGSNVGPSEAEHIATTYATSAPWHVNFSSYKLVESSQETKPSGRIDHTFTFEHAHEKVGDGSYRLQLVVSGNKVSALVHSIKIPEAFTRRYQQMRSANETFAYASELIMYLLYLIGCLSVGLLFLFRIRWVVWRPALLWAIGLAFLSSMTIFNTLPLQWMQYNTAFSPYTFIAQQVMLFILQLLMHALLFAAVFMGAESLTRYAFGNQVQLWKSFSLSGVGSYTILGYTISAYLLVPFELAYTVLFYFATTSFFHWWTPSSALFDPNILSSYFPWLESITLSLQAGFYEECLYRAIPLASAALLGNRYGKRRWWIGGALILQAVIFGAAHANYPAQPAYARLVELLAFSSILGAIYLKFGLVIAIISHFVYDVFWFSLPLFVATAPTAWISKIAVISFAGIPLWIIGLARIKEGKWHTLASNLYNKAWHPTEQLSVAQASPLHIQNSSISSRARTRWCIAGIVAVGCWLFTTRFTADTFRFSTDRPTIVKQAQNELIKQGISPAAWYPLVYPITQFEQFPDVMKRHRFIWQRGGKELYQTLLHSYVTPQLWVTRFVTWQGDLVQRSEEYHVYFMPDGTLRRITHKLPESAPGVSLSQADAIQKAKHALIERFHIPKEQLKEIGAVATKQPNRTDWKITYADSAYPLQEGEARIDVLLAGEQVVDMYRFIYVPETWERAYDNHQAFANILSLICWLLFILLFISALLLSMTRWESPITPTFFLMLTGFSGLLIANFFNQWPFLTSALNTSQPWNAQLFQIFGIPLVIIVLQAALITFLINVVAHARSIYRPLRSSLAIPIGISIGFLMVGAWEVSQYLAPQLSPTWANFDSLATILSTINTIITVWMQSIVLTLIILLLVMLVDLITNHWSRLKWAGVLLFLTGGIMRSGLYQTYTISLMIGFGLLFALLLFIAYRFVIRFDYAVVPIITGTYSGMLIIQQLIFNAFPHAVIAYIVALLAVAGTAWYWYHVMHIHNQRVD